MIKQDMISIFHENEKRILDSGVRDVFLPHTPIDSESLFKGREAEVAQILSAINTPGRHVLLYGDRGVGKSSLANVSCNTILSLYGRKIIKKRCVDRDTFRSIVTKILEEAGVDIHINSTINEFSGSLNGLIGGKQIKQYIGYTDDFDSPSWVADKIAHVNGIFLIDEFDSIPNPKDKEKIAELIKLLSDMASKLKIVVVGIASSINQLTNGHPSVQRCLSEIQLRKMSLDELREIIKAGQERLGIRFSREAIFRIIFLSSGYPHFTHLLALKAAERAIINEEKCIDLEDLNEAISNSVNDCESSLKTLYNNSVQGGNVTYKKILYAAALCREEFIKSKDLKFKYQQKFSEEISSISLNNSISKLVSNNNDKILMRVYKGTYRFTDPRMSSYIRIVQADMYVPEEDPNPIPGVE